MKEFGSDFHFVDTYYSKWAHLMDVYHDAVLLADGRQCIVALIRQYGWHRMWMPEYFCYEVIDTIREQTGIEIVYYQNWPSTDDRKVVEALPYQEGDVLFRVNFFGMRDFRSNKNIPVPVIEDHTHDLLGPWALRSDADWCMASLRKSLPIPEGGMLWSPKGYTLEQKLTLTGGNEKVAATRWEGMEMKAAYLNGELKDKEAFRKRYIDTEEWLDHAGLSLIDERSKDYIGQLDINAWMGAKRRNWIMLRQLVKADVVTVEDESCNPFSFIILAESEEKRNEIRKRLIERSVYPAILWNVPESTCKEVQDFSHRMLSIHCDGRYTEDDMQQLAAIVNGSAGL